MKRTLVIAVLCMLLLATVGTTAAVAKKPAEQTDFSVQYIEGKTYVFTPSKFTHSWGVDPNSLIGTPTHREFSKGASLFATMQTTETQAMYSSAGLHTDWRLVGATAADMGKPCTITFTVSYQLQATGDADTLAQVTVVSSWQNHPDWQDRVTGDATDNVKTVSTTLTFTSTVGDTFLDAGNGLQGFALVFVNAGQGQPGAGQATAQAQVSKITLAF
ncbi:MAG: hypothetical protein ACXV2E_00925 [Halobacteriota archaeon]